jgi:predicted small lipoprotein YifL
MTYIKRIIVICIILFFITGCGVKNPTLTPNSDNVIQTSAANSSINPETSGTSYPEPVGGSEPSELTTITSHQVEQLIIPTPTSGKAVVTGELKAAGDTGGLNLEELFLLPIASSDASKDFSSVTFSNASDPVATIEIGTGKFVFTDIIPGKYALMIWTSMRAYPIGDTPGNTITFTVNPDESKDLGMITIP